MISSSTIFDIIVLGGGPAGSTAAVYASRALLKTLVIGGNPPGGQLVNTTEIENFPGFPNGILGPELVSKIRKQMEKHGATIVDENAVKITGSYRENFTVDTDAGNRYFGKTVIIATGASAKWLDLESEQRLRGYGVSACATCDAPFFRGKILAVVGGGDASMEESIYLTRFAKKVYLITRSEEGKLRASKIMQKEALDNPKIEFLYNTEIKEVLGEKSVEGLKVVNNKTGEERIMEDVKGLFVSIGHYPNTGFLKGFVELDEKEYIKKYGEAKTSVEGVFAAGDVQDFRYRQAITASGYGCMAATEAIKFLSEKM